LLVMVVPVAAMCLSLAVTNKVSVVSIGYFHNVYKSKVGRGK